MVVTDIVFIPAALWVAVALKFGKLPEGFAAIPLPCVLALLVSVPILVRLGLYRAVVRFIEPRIILVILAGVTASTAILLLADVVLASCGIPVTDVAIY